MKTIYAWNGYTLRLYEVYEETKGMFKTNSKSGFKHQINKSKIDTGGGYYSTVEGVINAMDRTVLEKRQNLERLKSNIANYKNELKKIGE